MRYTEQGKRRKGPGGIVWVLTLAAVVTVAVVLLTVTARGMGV